MDYYSRDSEITPLLDEEEEDVYIRMTEEELDPEQKAEKAFEDMLDAELTMGTRLLINVNKVDMIRFLSLKNKEEKKQGNKYK